MLLSGDKPAFAYFAPTDVGKMGTLYVGLITPRGGKWLHDFAEIESVYQPELTRHIVADPILSGGSLELTAVPLSSAEGFVLRLRWIHPSPESVRLVWIFGGASGYNTNYSARIDKLQLSSDDAKGNALHVWGDSFSLTAPTMKGRELWGRCDLPGRLLSKDAGAVAGGPLSVEQAGPSKTPVATFAGDWLPSQEAVQLFFCLGNAATLEAVSRPSATTFSDSVKFYRTLAKRVEITTPDPYLDLAVQAMVVANDGLWQPPALLHGAMSWMEHFLGWRGWYGSDALGWHDRVRSSILAHAARQLQQGDNRGAIPHMLEDPEGVYYNMDEVFLDQVYYHYNWTGDRALITSLFPVLKGVLAWEKRRLDSDDNALYENCLNTWISDSHWYSGGDCTQASAYMYRAHCLAAEAAQAAGDDPSPFLQEATRIQKAMNDKLWIGPSGHYAEFIDRLGLGRMHTEPELPTIYFPIDFRVTDQFQAYQMLRFTETSLRNETDIPRGGRLVWSSNWAPNYNRTYTHSTYDLVYAEALNLAIAYYRTGQFDKAYELVKGVYAGMYMGGIPGGLSCHAYTNGQQRANEEFGDAISMFARTVVEGVFGILPEMQREIIHISPGFPRDWKDASIATPDLAYRYHKTDSEVSLEVSTVRPARVHFRVPIPDARLGDIFINGVRVEAHVTPGISAPFVEATGAPGRKTSLRIRFEARKVVTRFRPIVVPEEDLVIRAEGAPIMEVKDPQGVLRQVSVQGGTARGGVVGSLGPHTLFVLAGGAEDARWEPINIEIRRPLEIVRTQPDFSLGPCHFVLRNNTAKEIRDQVKVAWAGQATSLAISLPPGTERDFVAQGSPEALLLGENRLEFTGASPALAGSVNVLYWPHNAPQAMKASWKTLRLDPYYNSAFSKILFHSFWSADYPYGVCRDYMLDHLVGPRAMSVGNLRLSDKFNDQGVFVTQAGIPFAQRQDGDNLVALSRWKEFPDSVRVPVEDSARRVYFLISGVTFPMQSQIANVRLVVNYADGENTIRELVNPDNFDNGWGGFGGTYHYAANGSEVMHGGPWDELQDIAQIQPLARPLTILGQHGTPDAPERLFPPHADIVDVACDPARKIRDVEIEVLANEIIVALHGITLLK
jgi:hypothetical protein